MKTLVLIQHGQCVQNVEREARHWPDSANGLTDLGRRQTECVAVRLEASLAGAHCRVLSSNLTRAVQAGEIISRRLWAACYSTPELREWSAGISNAVSAEETERFIQEQPWSLFDWRPFPGAESWREFQARVSRYMTEQSETWKGQRLPLIVAHPGTIATILVWWLGLPLDALPERMPFTTSPGSITILKENRHGHPVLERLNDRAHLLNAGLAADEGLPIF